MVKRHYEDKVISNLGAKIRRIRIEKGWTLEECEERGGPNWRQLQAIESGKNVTIRTLVRLANLFGVSPAYLLE